MKRTTWLRGALVLVAVCSASAAIGADHIDSPAAVADPTADITDLYTWLDGSNVVFALNVTPLAVAGAKFSDKIAYVVHTESTAKFGMPGQKTDIICTFDAAQTASCWVGDKDYVTGDASATTGIKSASGKLRVFAGLRDDPFFFNLEGFKDTVATVDQAEPLLQFDPAGCPAVDAATSAALVGMLSHTQKGSMPPKDFFGGKNVLSIVLSIDKSLLNGGGAFVAAWASTNKVGG
ncbi:MAG: DUF4331 family protein [Byssovorax sp.]